MPDGGVSDSNGSGHGGVVGTVRHDVDSHHHHSAVSQLLIHALYESSILKKTRKLCEVQVVNIIQSIIEKCLMFVFERPVLNLGDFFTV